MSAEILRRAAALMRERAEADGSQGWRVEDANEGLSSRPLWMVTNDAFHNPPANDDDPWLAVEVHTGTRATAEHIASWPPDVALAVAKAMDDVALAWEIADGWTRDLDGDAIRFEDTVDGGWLAVARTYLGQEAS